MDTDPISPRARAAIERLGAITGEIDSHRDAIHALAVERTELVRLVRPELSLARLGALLGISPQAVAKLQRRA